MPTGTSSAKPTIAEVKKQVDKLYHEAEAAQERYHDANLELTELRRELTTLRADQERQRVATELVRAEVEDSVVAQYEGQTISAVGQVIVSDDPQAFLGQLSTMTAYNELQNSLYADYAIELKALKLRTQATNQRARQVATVEQRLRSEQQQIDDKLAEAKQVLGELEEEERQRLLAQAASGGPVELPSNISASGRAALAVRYAMAQVGDAYVYGAAGPNAFDCSGLTMMAWAQAGVGLPHSSSAQFGSGPHIPASALQPGDLVFYYSPISHVAMYIGNGLIVHAAHPGAGVRVAGLYSMPYVGAVRPG
ncbi:MAG: NlpC/P60 family protein [Nocardioides sp.]